jgi:hypothetical protein
VVSESLPDSVVRKATNLVRDARQATVVGLIPILGLIFILRLVQWYLLRNAHPQLVSAGDAQHAELTEDFQGALPRLWFAVLFWPIMIVVVVIYLFVTD